MSNFTSLNSLSFYFMGIFPKTFQLSHKFCKEYPHAEDSPLKTIPTYLCGWSTESTIFFILDSLCLKLMGAFY